MDLLGAFAGTWHYLVACLALILAIVGSGHAVLYKRDSRAAVLWGGIIWLIPLGGAVLYFLLGVNRIRRRAVLLRGDLPRHQTAPSAEPISPETLARELKSSAPHLSKLAQLVERVVARPLVPGNCIEALIDGDQAYPAMLGAIAGARRSISLSTYIFDRDRAGHLFVAALAAAVERGVEVRVLIDDAGARYSWPPVTRALRRAGVRVARFLPSLAPWRLMGINLRNHRKILVVDGSVGFSGGINIRAGHVLKDHPAHPVQDLHFRMEGPAVAQLQEIFADDWLFTTGEALRGEDWFPKLKEEGTVIARGISDGPDEDFEKLRWTILGALSVAQQSVRVLTPYFLPDQAVISALNIAAMRGVAVEIILPSRSNLPFVHWATFALLWQLLERGCRVWLTPPPFDHSKLLLVDGEWALLGSANWDPRSLRLNFEFNIECYDAALGRLLGAFLQQKLTQARELTLADVDSRSLPLRLRDGIARLWAPYL